jgi:hypothetical protein
MLSASLLLLLLLMLLLLDRMRACIGKPDQRRARGAWNSAAAITGCWAEAA